MGAPIHRVVLLLLIPALILLCTCGRPSPENSSAAPDSQKLPFDRQSHGTGITPSHTLIPITTKLPEGTPIPIRLRTSLSSATAHAGDTFEATIDEPLLIDGQLLIASGSKAEGRVLEAKASTSAPKHSSSSSFEPGYLRIVLVSVNVGDRPVLIETSSIFVKGRGRDERNISPSTVVGEKERISRYGGDSNTNKDGDVEFAVDRRLDFRLAQTVDLQ